MNITSIFRRSVTVSAALAATAALALTGTAPVTAAEASYPVSAAIPADCGDSMAAVDRSGIVRSLSVEGRTVSWSRDRGHLGYQPLDLYWYGGAGYYEDEDNYAGMNSAITIHPGGQLVNTTHHSEIKDGKVTENRWSVARKWGNGWQDTEDLTMSRSSYYRLTPDGHLFRYNLMDAGGKVHVFNNAKSIRTVEYDRTIEWKGGKADVLLTNLSNGTLREYVIPHASPTQWSSYNLRTSGWGGFQQFSSMPCGETGRVVMGYLDDRRMAVYYDRNRFDFSASDWTGTSVPMPALPVGTLAYG